ncbi:MAG TPA: Bax inhibitor-1/YccA family protein [Candidatus Limnocylindrales bacterium]|nr:Bax inhibitor-1/YccA family protein [Candidatus Limnocylindrales bacterium]
MNDSRSPYGSGSPYGAPSGLPSSLGVRPAAALSAGFLSQAFAWMFAGLLMTAGVAFLVQSNERLLSIAAGLFMPALLVELGLVFAISLGITRLPATLALGLFFVYAAVNGVTFGLIFVAYDLGSVAAAFLSASAMFGGAALYGAVTKRSLASWGGYLTMGLIGLLVAMVVNAFVGFSVGNVVISIAGVVIFTALTAYDVQRIATGDIAVMVGSMERAAVISALRLYLDFVNLFLMFLRLFGNRR